MYDSNTGQVDIEVDNDEGENVDDSTVYAGGVWNEVLSEVPFTSGYIGNATSATLDTGSFDGVSIQDLDFVKTFFRVEYWNLF